MSAEENVVVLEFLMSEDGQCLMICPFGVRGGKMGKVLKIGSYFCTQCKYYRCIDREKKFLACRAGGYWNDFVKGVDGE